MPPNQKLPEADIAHLREWMTLGTADPRQSDDGDEPRKNRATSIFSEFLKRQI